MGNIPLLRLSPFTLSIPAMNKKHGKLPVQSSKQAAIRMFWILIYYL